MGVALAASLALNLFLGGVVAGRLIGPPGHGPRGGPPSPERMIEDMAGALGPEDARVLRAEFAAVPRPTLDFDAAREPIARALRADPFDPDAFKAAIVHAEGLADQGKAAVLNAVVSAIGKMSIDGRRRLADWRPPGP